mgnify:CR=1 FL=1
MIIKQVRLSQQSKEQLSRLKAKTGIKNWNILCRWALAYSLSEKTLPTDLPIVADSNLEMSWYTFGGEYYEIYEALIKAWCLQMHLPTDDETSLKMLQSFIIGIIVSFISRLIFSICFSFIFENI